jgi:hypothetical protein
VQFKAGLKGEIDATRNSTLNSIQLIMMDLRAFSNEMSRYCDFCDFCVFDILDSNDVRTTKVYRLGSEPEEAKPIRDQSSSFRRIMYVRLHNTVSSQAIMLSSSRFCEGLSLVHYFAQAQGLSPIPYLSLIEIGTRIKRTIDLHLECSRQEGSELANPYSDVSTGFHITFYEVVLKKGLLQIYDQWKGKEKWKVGYLYEKSGDLSTKDRLFRQSAFTVRLRLLRQRANTHIRQVLAMSDHVHRTPAGNQQEAFEQYWTLLLLTPSGFFQRPLDKQDEFIIDWKNERVLSKIVAELIFISHALKEVAKRWTRLHDEIERLLSEDFMDPKIYVRLIFDDESFTRSRLYFWVIGCLNEFLVSIEDNIKQWKLFREARVTLLLKHLPKSDDESQNTNSTSGYPRSELERLRSLDQSTEGIRENLESLRSRFTTQLETVKALRDGVSDVIFIWVLHRNLCTFCFTRPRD